ncbi:MAG: hypothetical protein AB7R69_03845 [Candidatus Babeliales bacterium]
MKKKYCVLALLFSSVLSARHDYDQSGPLFQPYSFTVKGGVAPSVFSYKGSLYAAVIGFNPLVFRGASNPAFNSMWSNYPINIDFDLGYALSNHVELFGEFNYRHARRKQLSFEGISPLGTFGTLFPHLDNFQAFGGYAGFRYFSRRFACDALSFFVGLKFGTAHYQKVRAKPLHIVNAQGQILDQNSTWFRSNSVPSGGLQTGFDVLVAKSFSLFFNAEFVASAAPRPLTNFVKKDQGIFPAFTNLIRESSGTLFSFPFTLGLRYYFGGCK